MTRLIDFHRWIAIILVITLGVGIPTGGSIVAAGSEVLDQSQTNYYGNTWVNHDYPRYQTFTPAISGQLSRIELNNAGTYGSVTLIVSLYKNDDLSTSIASVQQTPIDGWVSFDFSSSLPYLKKGTKYRIVVSTDLGGSYGFGWYTSSGDPYKGGESSASGFDYTFKTYMIPDYSLSASESLVTAANSSLTADGTSQTSVTVTAKDAQGGDYTTGGAMVAITATLGTISAVTDNGNGTYTATLTAPTTAGTSVVSATIGGVSVGNTANIQFVAGPPSPGTSTVTVGSGTLTANGTSQTPITVTLNDTYGNRLTTGGSSVAITSTKGTVGPVTDNGNGVYTAILTAPTTVGSGVVSATVGGSLITSTVTVQFVSGTPSTSTSTVAVGSGTLIADGTSQTTVTVTLKDGQGNAITTGGTSVAITATKGTVSAVADNGNGTYTATLTAPTTVGTSTVSATVGGNAITSTATVQFVSGTPSTTTSTVAVGSGTLTADGTSQTTVTVTLKDGQGNAITTGGTSVAISATKGTISAVTDNGNGTYTATLTAPTTVGTSTISATIGGSVIASTATVQFVSGTPSTTTSTVAVGSGTLTADGTSLTTVTVTLKDGQGNAITTGGETVVINATKGTVSAVLDEGDGTYTAKLTAPTTVGTSTVSATVGGNAIASTATVQFVPGTPSATTSAVAVDNNTLTADGTSQATVTVTLKDAQGNAITTGGETVVITASKGTVSAVLDEGNGTYTATLTAPTIVGNSTVSATIGGNAIASTASITFVAGTPSVTTSTVAVDNNTLTADGASQATVTVTLKDAQGNEITTGGETVVITATSGTVSAATDKGDGTYTATLIAPSTVGTAILSATIGGNAIASTASITFVAGTPSATTSLVAVDNNTLTADGTSQATVTVTLKDAQGNAITTGGETVVITATKGTVSAVLDEGDGTYTATLTAPTTVGTSTVSATVGGNAIASTATVQFVPGTPSATTSAVAVDNNTLTADGTSQATVTVTLKDAQGNAITTGGDTVVITATKGTVSGVIDEGDGTYTAKLTAPTTVGTSTVSATVGGNAIASTATVQFVPGTPSATTSAVAVDNNTLTADGTSQATVTVTLKDAQGNSITTGGETVVITATKGTISAVKDEGDGTYTATLTAPTTVGTSTVSATVGGNAIASTASITFVAGTPSVTTSTVAVDKNKLTADGTSQATVTVTLKDAQGNAITTGGETVVITATKGTISAVIDEGDGTYTATLTAPTTVGTSTVSAKVGGSAIASTASVQIVPGTPSATTSTVAVDNNTLTADGTSQATVTVTLKDAQGNSITTGGETVVITATKGTISAVIDEGDGTYTATLTAPTTVGTSTVSATIGVNAITSTASVQIVPGTPSATISTVTVDNNTLTADGTSQATVTVTLKDAQGNAITTGGDTVVITATKGTVSAVIDEGNGTYTATLTAPTIVGNSTVSATIGGNAIASTASITFVAGTPSVTTSTVAVDNNTLTADGTSQATVTVTLKDAQGNAITTGGDTVVITATKGTVSGVIDEGDGTYTAKLTAPTTVGTSTVSATIGGNAIASTASVQFIPGTPSATTSIVAVDNNTLTADGTSQATVTVTLKDAQGNAITPGGETVVINATKGTVSAVTDKGDGTYTATLTAPTTVGTSTVSAKVGGNAIASTATVQFESGTPSASTSTVAVGVGTLTADGTSQTNVTVTLKDGQGNAITTGGTSVAIIATKGIISAVTDNGNGTYTATLTAPTTVGTSTISATIGGSAITSTATVQFIPGTPSTTTSLVSVDNSMLTADGASQATVTVTLKDAQGNEITTGGETVVITATSGTVSAVTDKGDGTYTATLTAPTTVGTSTVSAKVGGNAIASTATVQFESGTPSASTSTVAVGVGTLTADGTSQTNVTVTLKDGQGNAITTGVTSVAISATKGTVSAVTDNGNGTYTATLTAPTTVGASTISATIGGSAIASTATVQFISGTPSTTTSLVSVDNSMLTADGASQATVTVTLKDAQGNEITTGGETVVITATSGTVSAVTDKGDGTYTATLTAPTIVGTSTVSAKVGGNAIASTASVQFVPGTPSATTSIVAVDNNTLTADGTSQATVTVTLKDAQGNAITTGGETVVITATSGTVSAVTDKGDGTYTATLTAPTTVGTATLSATVGGNAITSTTSVQFVHGTPSASTSTIAVDKTTMMADGKSQTNVTVTLKDAQGNAVTVGGDSVSITVSKGTVGTVVDKGDGTYVATLTSPTAPSKVSVTAKVNGSAIVSQVEVQFTAVPSVYPMPGSDNSVPVSINASQVSGMATVRTNSDGEKWLDIQIDSTSITQALESLTNSAKQEVMVSTQYEADNYVLQLSGMAVKLLNEHDASIILATKLGQYSLPLNEIVKQGSEWNNEDVIQITIQTSQLDELSGLQEEAAESGLHLIGDPVQFEVYVLHNGESKEITTFTGYVERIMFLPTNAGEASTVMVWDATKGLRPVPTQFVEVDGRSAAVVHSITNSVYVLVSRTSTLTDIQDHWAANEISDMNRRMIINGVNGSEFAPDKAITRAELAALLARALGLPQSDQSAGFTDVSDSSWYSASIAAVKAYGLMDGYKDGTFKPNQEISRQEAIVTMIRALQLTKGEAASSSIGSEVDLGAYSDNGQVGEWARTAIQTAIQEGLMKGYGDALYPTKSLTRAETAVLLYRMLQKAGFINE